MNKDLYLGFTTMSHGIKGELKFYPELFEFNQYTHLKLPVFINGQPHTITSVRQHKNHYLIRIDELEDINLIEEFRNQKVFIKRESLKLKDNDYLVSELIGYLVLEGQVELGKVSDIRYNNGGILLQVANKFYIPFQDNFIKEVLVNEKKIIVANAKGLMV